MNQYDIGYHWFPTSFINAASSTFCSETSIETCFYPFVSQWAETAAEGRAPSTTAKDVLGTNTAASLYYTATATSSTKTSKANSNWNIARKHKAGLAVGLLLGISVSW